MSMYGDVDFICGRPPCQGVSGFNHFRNSKATLEGIKNHQLLVFMDIIEFLKPRYVLMENVVDILKFASGFFIRYAIRRLVSVDYQTRLGVFVADSYDDKSQDERKDGTVARTKFQKCIKLKQNYVVSFSTPQHAPHRGLLYDHQLLKLNEDDFEKVYRIPKRRYIQVGNAVAVSVGIVLGYTFGQACQGLSNNQVSTALPFKFANCLAHSSSMQVEDDSD
ncbi:hypothetical protein Pint_34080 [Pistacia integerrima]|uniref:Uncharacterized protein n=1 Tax=Pistacia integerrima TaxID=434235 RepID=A0ACC0X7Q2_9ROSI|nr:hypothetical protein Pint_34080 [Pistacia integerrima]